MKPKSSCDLCRQRHRKCITRPNAARCNGCDELDRECTLSPNFQFHHSRLSGIDRVNWSERSPQEQAAGPISPELEVQNQDPGAHASEQERIRSIAAIGASHGVVPRSPANTRTPGVLTRRE